MKRKVNVNRPEISSEEIAGKKDFDSVIKQFKGSGKPFFKKPFFLSSLVAVTVAVVTSVVLLQNHNQPKPVSDQPMVETDANLLADFYKKEQSKPCVHPPLKGINVEYTVFKVDAQKGGALEFKTGSKLIIPKNAFSDKNGNLLKGEIELRYREFHDAVDFFVSGIPMTYDSAGVKYQFESAGMMEMLAYQNGEPIKMATGKSINVEMASNYKGNEYNLYNLDTLHNNWSCLGKDKVANDMKDEAKADRMQRNEKPLTKQQKRIVDSTSNYITKIVVEKEKKINELLVSNRVPVKPKQSQKTKYTFNISVDQKEFQELAIYKGVLFEVGDENKNFNSSLYDITWDDASLKVGTKKGENYLLTLKKGLKKYEFVVYPVYEGKDFETAKSDYDYLLSRYNEELEIRKQQEKQIEEGYKQMVAFAKKQQEDQVRQWKEQEANQFKQMDNQEKAIRMFTVSGFGIYNLDCAKSYPQGALSNAKLVNEKNVPLLCYEIYLVDKARNGLFTYYKNPVSAFSYNPESTNILWTVENGVMYWLKPEQFNEMKSTSGEMVVKMNRVGEKFTSVEGLKDYFKL